MVISEVMRIDPSSPKLGPGQNWLILLLEGVETGERVRISDGDAPLGQVVRWIDTDRYMVAVDMLEVQAWLTARQEGT